MLGILFNISKYSFDPACVLNLWRAVSFGWTLVLRSSGYLIFEQVFVQFYLLSIVLDCLFELCLLFQGRVRLGLIDLVDFLKYSFQPLLDLESELILFLFTGHLRGLSVLHWAFLLVTIAFFDRDREKYR